MSDARQSGRPHWAMFAGLAAVVVVVDQVSKAWLVEMLVPGERRSVIGDLLRLVHGQNDGAIFGLFRDQAMLFGVVSLVVVGMIVWYQAASGRNAWMSLALGLLLGGAIGNMIDRFRLGYVIDWVDAGIGDWRFYTFNVADSAISAAVLLLALSALAPGLLARRRGDDRPDTPADDTVASDAAVGDARHLDA